MLLFPCVRVRLYFVRNPPTFVMLSAAKHLANKGNLRFFSYAAGSFADAQDDKNDGSAPQNVVAHGYTRPRSFS